MIKKGTPITLSMSSVPDYFRYHYIAAVDFDLKVEHEKAMEQVREEVKLLKEDDPDFDVDGVLELIGGLSFDKLCQNLMEGMVTAVEMVQHHHLDLNFGKLKDGSLSSFYTGIKQNGS